MQINFGANTFAAENSIKKCAPIKRNRINKFLDLKHLEWLVFFWSSYKIPSTPNNQQKINKKSIFERRFRNEESDWQKICLPISGKLFYTN